MSASDADDVVNLAEIVGAPNPRVVAVLEDMLSRARTGDVIGVAIGAAHQGRHTASVFEVGEAAIADLYLGLERCKARLLSMGANEA